MLQFNCAHLDFCSFATSFTTVRWRYGHDASQATDTALTSVVNVGITAYNVDNLGIKAILKATGKQAAKAVVKSPEGEDVEERPEPGAPSEDGNKKDGNK